jgi:nucleotide-binding universal stress UspA family protein
MQSMNASGDLFVVLDGTSISNRVLDYVAGWMAGSRDEIVNLAYVGQRLPARLLETGGSERSDREEQIEAGLHREQARWTAAGDRRVTPILKAARRQLEGAGVAAERIRAVVSSPLDLRSVADEVLLLAGDAKCGTIVLGHHTHTRLRELGNEDLADQLVRRAKNMVIWVVD